MGAAGTVNEYLPDGDDGAEVKLDLGGDDLSHADHLGPAGDDAPPLEGDFVVSAELDGDTQTLAAVGYADDTDRVAAPGEKRIYARDSSGAVTAELYLKGDGSFVLEQTGGTSMTVATDGSATLDVGGGVGVISIDSAGAISLSGTSVSMQTGSALGPHFAALHAGITAWIPVPMDGGAALKAALAAYLAQTPPGP